MGCADCMTGCENFCARSVAAMLPISAGTSAVRFTSIVESEGGIYSSSL